MATNEPTSINSVFQSIISGKPLSYNSTAQGTAQHMGGDSVQGIDQGMPNNYGATGTGTLSGGGSQGATSTGGSGFDWGKFLQSVGAIGSSVYNAVNAPKAAQQIANTADPFASQRPYYQDLLKQTLGKQENPYQGMFNEAYKNQSNPYSGQYQSMLANQNNPYAAPIQSAINNQSNPYATMIQQQWGHQDNPYAAQLQGLLKDPNSFQTDPGYQFALSQGQKGIERASNALYGTARAGSLAPELAKYTEGYANQAYSDRINQLSGLTNAQNNYNANSMNTLANLSGNQNSYNTNFLNSLGSLSGQQQTTNTNQLNTVANLIGGQNQYNISNLGALSGMYGTTGNINSNAIQQLLTASGATSGSPAAAASALQSGQQGQYASIGAALQQIPGLAQYVPQILQMLGGGNGDFSSNFPVMPNIDSGGLQTIMPVPEIFGGDGGPDFGWPSDVGEL